MADPGYITGATAVLTDPEAWIALNSTTLTSDTAYITFTSGYNDAAANVGGVQAWDQYMDLVMICYVRSGDSGANERTCYLSLNGSSSNADYDGQELSGNGSTPTAAAVASHILFPVLIGDNSTANAFCGAIAHFFDINSGKYKSFSVQAASDYDGAGEVYLSAMTFLKQDPLISIKVWPSSGDLKDGSRIDLFGVLPRMTPGATTTVAT